MSYGFLCAKHGPAWSYCIPCRAAAFGAWTFWTAVRRYVIQTSVRDAIRASQA